MPDTTYDFIIIGSGFGGSVSAYRLASKGYKVAVIEQGRRFVTGEYAKSNWNLWKSIWAPMFGMHGILSITTFKDVVIFHGAGVGGGSLVYANTHLEPFDGFFNDPRWKELGPDWRAELAPYYAEARRMLGSNEPPAIFESDKALKEVLDDLGTGDSFKKHTVGIFFGAPGKEIADPYFGGEGPARTGCTFCGACMIGCNVGAKNSLDKNYLYLAEKLGAEVIPDTKVLDVRPIADANGLRDGSAGYEVVTTPTGWLGFSRKTLRAKQVVFAAGVLGTVKLLSECKDKGSLAKVSDTLGTYVRTNSESIQGVMVPGKDISRGVAISSGGLTPDGTHIEIVRYGPNADAMAFLTTVHAGGGPLPRQFYWLKEIVKHPRHFLRSLWPFGWSKTVAIVLAMQAVDNSMRLNHKRNWWWPFSKTLSSDWGDKKAPPTFMPAANEVAQKLAEKMGGIPGSVLPEVALDTTTTAHILGGCPMGKDAADGVIDTDNRVFNYKGMYVVDGSMIGANLGVNPTLTITAMAERAMAKIPPKNAVA
jgi:cholesterol oxidase